MTKKLLLISGFLITPLMAFVQTITTWKPANFTEIRTRLETVKEKRLIVDMPKDTSRLYVFIPTDNQTEKCRKELILILFCAHGQQAILRVDSIGFRKYTNNFQMPESYVYRMFLTGWGKLLLPK